MRIKTVVTLDGLVWKRSSYPIYIRKMLLLTARIPFYFSNSVIVDSKSVQSWYAKNFGKLPIYIPYGANTDKSEPDESQLAKRGLSKRNYVLFVGRLVREKGVHYQVEAFNRIYTGLNLVIVGGDPYGSQYERLLKRMANGNIIFTGNVYGKECENLYKGAYLYVSPSDLEGTSPAILTALGVGKCTLVSDIPENLETIGNAGFSFRHGNVEDLKEKLSNLLEHPDLVKGSQEKAFDRINKYYNWDKITEQLVDIYSSIIDGLGEPRQQT